jgi:hypothetical protein
VKKITMRKWLNRLVVPAVAALAMAVLLPVASASPCSIKSRSETLVVMVCAPGQAADDLRDVGRAACKEKTMCNVWIWDDPSKAPDKAPRADSEIPKQQAADAIAIWVNDSQSLISLKRVNARK